MSFFGQPRSTHLPLIEKISDKMAARALSLLTLCGNRSMILYLKKADSTGHLKLREI